MEYFYLPFGPGLFYSLRVTAKVQLFLDSLVGPLALGAHNLSKLKVTKSRSNEGHTNLKK